MNRPILKTRNEIADELGISTRTLHRWLKKHNLSLSRNKYLTRTEYEEVMERLGCIEEVTSS